MKKNLKILSVILATVLCFAFSTTAFAATVEAPTSNPEEVGFSQEELKDSLETGKPIQKVIVDGESTYTFEIAPSNIITPCDGYFNYNTWYDLSVTVNYGGKDCGVAIQTVYIGYVSGYYFGEMKPLRYSVFNDWAGESVTSSGGFGSQYVNVRAYFKKGSVITGAQYEWFINSSNGYVTATRK